MRAGAQAGAWARRQITDPSRDWYRYCLMFVRMCFGVAMREPDAGKAWDAAEHKHVTSDAGSIPAWVPVFWELPGVADHVALSIGAGKCISTDVRRRGRVDVVTIDSITTNWGAQLLGWTEDLNGVRVWTPQAADVSPNRVQNARAKLRAARRAIADAGDLLDSTPDERELAHLIAAELDRLVERVSGKLQRLPKR